MINCQNGFPILLKNNKTYHHSNQSAREKRLEAEQYFKEAQSLAEDHARRTSELVHADGGTVGDGGGGSKFVI